MITMTKTAAAVAAVLALSLLVVQPAEAGDRDRKYRSHHSHHHFRGQWHSWHRGFVPGKRSYRSRHAHRRSLLQFWYVPAPRTVVVRPYVPPPVVSALPPRAWVPAMTCREYTRDVIINGRPAAAYGRACLQPDGSWRIMAD